MKKKIYIAGAGGMLGEAFYRVFKEEYDIKCTDKDVNEDWLSLLDFRDFDNYKKDVVDFKPDFLFHLGAYTDLEYCEVNLDDTYLTNTTAVENAVIIANELQIPVLYISTAGIFDGKKDFYDDWDEPNPLGHYARSKYMGERYVREHAERYIICRAGWMMGGGPKKDKKFINKIIKQLATGTRDLHIVNDKDGTPTFTVDFAKNVKLLFEKEYWGLYNLVCNGETSRKEVAEELVRILGLQDEVTIHEVTSDYFKDTYFAPRPPSERLINKKLDLRDMNKMRDWKVALDEYVNDYFGDFVKEHFESSKCV
ncbi:SDR family oxidoreductase [Pedobacter antarcticus]|uniref:dTDP-4-dehydrorhamnose reductase n=2 Tax=Pedobacter antarcticus TaxID=34086 RepID=A0A081PG61_9SPHI|nr:NAD(P)-dependent oxidoreductase [Pedobacter antarcticus]KEQ29684.1 dTDP-4-dehydrorhamnose reductase [Pedobacter antarcticus 4BY]SDM16762.1 dTDP-4-dehydrorhamnose reductase [Pedobacter antarcticus]SFF13250.1 dTDP-4-dehydrorhamnose reductase [Pedobacter antarcticus]